MQHAISSYLEKIDHAQSVLSDKRNRLWTDFLVGKIGMEELKKRLSAANSEFESVSAVIASNYQITVNVPHKICLN